MTLTDTWAAAQLWYSNQARAEMSRFSWFHRILLFCALAPADVSLSLAAELVPNTSSAARERFDETLFADASGPLLLAQPPTASGELAGGAADSSAPPPAEPAQPKARNFYVKSRGYRVTPESDPPRYVHNGPQTGYPYLDQAPWLDIGLEQRTRFEYRDDSFLRTPQAGQDYPFLLRTRLYLGIKEVLDPFRMVVEYQDSRWENHDYASTNREVNENEPIQMYGELHFKSGLGEGRPLYIRGGRMAFELVDRRLIANNEFRNTTNTFQGLRIHGGKETQPWEVDILVLQPIDRLMYDFDVTFEDQWFYGAVGSIRQWSQYATVQPYWLGLSQGQNEETAPTPAGTFSIQTTGIRAYGLFGASGFDWDADVVYQWGDARGGLSQVAGAAALELGYTVEDSTWKPRFSGFFGYGTGDENPDDRQQNNFNALFGFNQPWSRNDYFSWDNAIQPKVRLEMTPLPDLLVDLGIGAFWLASSRAPWARAQLFDPTGGAGNWVGTEYDIRFRYRLLDYVSLDTSYSRFNPGTFPTRLGKGLSSNFFYMSITLSPFN